MGVDENGTTMAAATGEVMVPVGIAPQLWLDRPFFFFVYDHGTGTVLFVGRLVRPAGAATPPAEPPAVATDIAVICSGLATCTGRTTTEAECQAALAADEPAVVEQCDDCILVDVDDFDLGFVGDRCEPATCAEHCPDHTF